MSCQHLFRSGGRNASPASPLVSAPGMAALNFEISGKKVVSLVSRGKTNQHFSPPSGKIP